jgi:hypothetical protein
MPVVEALTAALTSTASEIAHEGIRLAASEGAKTAVEGAKDALVEGEHAIETGSTSGEISDGLLDESVIREIEERVAHIRDARNRNGQVGELLAERCAQREGMRVYQRSSEYAEGRVADYRGERPRGSSVDVLIPSPDGSLRIERETIFRDETVIGEVKNHGSQGLKSELREGGHGSEQLRDMLDARTSERVELRIPRDRAFDTGIRERLLRFYEQGVRLVLLPARAQQAAARLIGAQ